jgi:outer membrane protein TolC
MTRHHRTCVTFLLIYLVTLTGCHPTQPFYFRESGNLANYLDKATEIEYADVETPRLADVEHAHTPLTISNPEFNEIWDLSLEEAISIALNNSKVMKNLGFITTNNQFGSNARFDLIANATTVYDPAIVESSIGVRRSNSVNSVTPSSDGAARANQIGGVEDALSEFDAQFQILSATGSPSLISGTDRPQNIRPNAANPFFAQSVKTIDSSVTSQLFKRTATGAGWFVRNRTTYGRGNSRGGIFNPDGTLNPNSFQALNSTWTDEVEVEWVQPLARGRGTQINRIPIVLARMNTDISLADFEANVRNLVSDVENTYWDLQCAYRNLETTKIGRDSAQGTWKIVYEKWKQGVEPVQAEAQARGQYFQFRSLVERSLQDLYGNENRLRFLMGIAATDGRLIRPSDEPTVARVDFDWHEIHCEALTRSPELRRQQWVIKQRELELISARNQLLPKLDVRTLYRWVGVGDDFFGNNGAAFPQPNSSAMEELFGGNYQEFAVGVDFEPARFGARRELAQIRNAQLAMTRDKARLEEMELAASNILTTAVRDLDTQYILAQTHFNRWNATQEEVQSLRALYEGGKANLDLVLDAQRRRAEAQIDFYRAVCEYNKAIAQIHFRKGSLLEFNNVYLAEGPWPQKAYWDAMGQARKRDASHYFNYGWTRPSVVSRGPVPQHVGELEYDGEIGADERGEVLPTPVPTPARPRERELELPMPAPETPQAPLPGPITGNGNGPVLQAPSTRPEANEAAAMTAPQSKKVSFDWGKVGLDSPERSGSGTRTTIRQVDYDEPAMLPVDHAPTSGDAGNWKGTQR